MSQTQLGPLLSTPEALEVFRSQLLETIQQFRERFDSEVLRLEGRGLELSERVDAIAINTQVDVEAIAEPLRELSGFSKEAADFFEPWRLFFYEPYQAILDRKKTVLSGPEAAIAEAKEDILKFNREETERQRVAAQIANDQQRKDEEARKLEMAIDAESQGLAPAAVQTIMDAPSTLPTITPQKAKVAGLSNRENWNVEVDNLELLILAAAEEITSGKFRRLTGCLQPNLKVLRLEAVKYQTAIDIPGVRAVDKGTLAVRS